MTHRQLRWTCSILRRTYGNRHTINDTSTTMVCVGIVVWSALKSYISWSLLLSIDNRDITLTYLCQAKESNSRFRKPFTAKPEVKIWQNRKSKLTPIDFPFHFNTMYGPIGHHFDTGNYFRSCRSRKYWNPTSIDFKNNEHVESTSCLRKSFQDKPKVSRKPEKWTPSHRLPIRPQCNVRLYRPPFRR